MVDCRQLASVTRLVPVSSTDEEDSWSTCSSLACVELSIDVLDTSPLLVALIDTSLANDIVVSLRVFSIETTPLSCVECIDAQFS